MSERIEALTSEIVPQYEDVVDVITAGALKAMTSVWRTYNDTPLEERSSEEITEVILFDVLTDVGIERSRAQELCVIAKLNAQL